MQEIKSVTKDITVKVFRGDTPDGVEKALRIFKKKIQASGLFKTMKEKRYFEKPGDKMRRKRRENQRRLRKTEKGKNRR